MDRVRLSERAGSPRPGPNVDAFMIGADERRDHSGITRFERAARASARPSCAWNWLRMARACIAEPPYRLQESRDYHCLITLRGHPMRGE